MKKVIINGDRIRDRKELHAELKRGFGFPEWYGGNLDALADCLTESGEETELEIQNLRALKEQLGDYSNKLLKVLTESAAETGRLKLTLR